ncbi:MFS transporter [Actinosynnema sp. NPDC050436]|uniref:MFS transporter n=1 Tax=Actinosynnema sp. NPDC050436 TaxID=3155659 RepID=UPI0033DAD67E
MEPNTATESPGPKAGKREWIGLAVLALPTLLLSLDISVLNLALPHLSADLGATATEQLWIMDIYGFMIAGFLITWGALGDLIGRRKLLLIGATVFGASSVLAAFSTSPEMLIAARALLGISGATLMPSLLALISNMFRDPKQQGMAIGAWMSCFMGGMAIGPVVGGAMLQNWWWGSVFLLGVPVMALLLVLGPVLLPEHKGDGGGKLDLVSVALSLLTLLPFVYGVKHLAIDGVTALSVGGVLVGLVFGALFAARQRKLEHPLLDLRLFANRTLSSALGVALISSATMGGITLLVSVYLQQVAGLDPFIAGLWLVPAFALAVLGNMVAPAAAAKYKPAHVIAVGLLVTALGLVLLTFTDSVGSVALVVVGYAIAFAGTSPMGVLSTQLVVGSAPPEKAGAASALSETNGEFGISFGIAVLGTIGAAAYQSAVVVPRDLPPADAEAVNDSLPAAADVASRLPGDLADQVLGAARAAFTDGLHVVGWIAGGAMVLLAALVVAVLRHVPAPSAEGGQDEPVDRDTTAQDATDRDTTGRDAARQVSEEQHTGRR